MVWSPGDQEEQRKKEGKIAIERNNLSWVSKDNDTVLYISKKPGDGASTGHSS